MWWLCGPGPKNDEARVAHSYLYLSEPEREKVRGQGAGSYASWTGRICEGWWCQLGRHGWDHGVPRGSSGTEAEGRPGQTGGRNTVRNQEEVQSDDLERRRSRGRHSVGPDEQGPYGHGKPGEVMEFKNGYFPGLEPPFINTVWLKE